MIRAEAEGEVQEMIDIADFAESQSRIIYGLTMHKVCFSLTFFERHKSLPSSSTKR
jgi:hypothetical protein